MIFILGGRGLLGSAFARVCERRGEPYIVIDRQNYAGYAGESCDIFVNANGNSSKLLSKTDPLRDFDASVRSVRASITDFRYRLYLHISSCDVYPECSSPSTTREEMELEVARQSPYGFHKYLGEQCIRHGCPDWLIFRLGGMVGPGLKKNAIFDILKGGPLWLHPESALQFIQTDRAAEIMLDFTARSLSRRTFNLCGDGLIQLSRVVEFVGNEVPVSPGSPKVLYDVSVASVSEFCSLPKTPETVRTFIETELRSRQLQADA